MSSMIRSAISYLRKSAWIGLVFVFLYAIGSIIVKSSAPQEQPTATVDKLRKAEKQWQAQMSEKGQLEKYFKEHPYLGTLFNLISLVIFSATGAGLILNYLLISKPVWRRSLYVRPPPSHVIWSFKMLFTVLVPWIIFSLMLSFSLGFIRRWVWPGLDFNSIALFHTTVMDATIVYLIILTLKRWGGHPRDMGFWIEKKDVGREIRAGLAGYAALVPVFFSVLFIVMWITQFYTYEPAPHPLVEVFLEEKKESRFLIYYSLLLAIVLGPVMEEIFFRGFLYPIVKARWGRDWALILTSAFFALIHQNEFAFLPIFVLGMGLAILYEMRQNLVAPITLHVVHNAFFISYFFLAKQVLLK